VEERIPIKSTNQKWQMGFYLDHLEELTKPIQDFACLFSGVKFPDVDAGYRGIRCDNAPFFQDRDGQCKIALVDTESITFSKPDKALSTLVRFFPYHYDLLLATCREEDPSAIATRDRGLNRFKIEYIDYAAFLESKRIDLTTAAQVPRPSANVIEEIKLALFNVSRAIEKSFSSFVNAFFDAMEADYLPRLGALPELKHIYDFIGLRYLYAGEDVWQSQIREMEKWSKSSVQGKFLSCFLKQLKHHQCIYRFEIIIDILEGSEIFEIEF
jgi:hypothetical protein